MIDPTAKIVAELRAIAEGWPSPFDTAVIATRELEPEDIPKNGKAPRLVVIRRRPITRRGRQPLADYTYLADCYDPDPVNASTLAGLVSDAFHNIGPRVATAGGIRVGIFHSSDAGQSGALVEPGTRWPMERVSLAFLAPTIAVT